MAARRLIIVLVVLFVASIVAAALAPERRDSSGDETTTSTTTSATTTTTSEETTSEPEQEGGERAAAGRPRIRLEASEQDPPSARAEVGDQIELVIGSEEFLQIEIPAFGVTGNAAPAEPARFNVILRDGGQIPVLAARSGKTVAVLDVKPSRAGKKNDGSDGAEKERPEPAAANPGR